jgi:hypothetical protein
MYTKHTDDVVDAHIQSYTIQKDIFDIPSPATRKADKLPYIIYDNQASQMRENGNTKLDVTL